MYFKQISYLTNQGKSSALLRLLITIAVSYAQETQKSMVFGEVYLITSNDTFNKVSIIVPGLYFRSDR